jgi:hypothetical protein
MRRLLAGLGLLCASACGAGGVPDTELPERPIAVLYRTPEDSRRRAEAMAEAAGENAKQTPTYSLENEAIADSDAIRAYLKKALTGAVETPETKRFPGRLALLHPRTRQIEIVSAAWPGSMPHAWSPDRKRLLFSQLVDDYAQLFELDFESGEVRPITHGPEVHPSGCYGPEGSYVLMTVRVADQDVHTQIELQRPGESSPQPLTSGPRDHAPACAADGSAAAFVRSPGRKEEWVMVVDLRSPEAEPRRLGPGRDPRFCGSEWIVYSAPIQRGRRLWRVRPDGSGRAPIGRGVLDEEFPSCSPDGKVVAYGVVEEHRDLLYVRRFDGSGDRILFADGDAAQPVW